MDACTDCERGPAGIAGHDRLFSHTMHPWEMHFRCRECGQSWSRRAAGSSYAWTAIEGPAGPDVPGRPGTTPP